MGEAKRRRLGSGGDADAYADIASYLVNESADKPPQLMFGPVTWRPSDGATAKVWSFIVGTGNADKHALFHRIEVCDGLDPDETRAKVQLALVAHRPCVMIDFDDELRFVQACESLWPCEKATRIRKTIEAERASKT
jgi:hypothetical protein